MAEFYDAIVIGAGPAGMNAALYISRANRRVLMLDKGLCGGQMNNTDKIDNYLGFKSIKGADLAKAMKKSSLQFGAKFDYGDVQKITFDKKDESLKHVFTDVNEYVTPAVIIATGSNPRKLGLKSEKHYYGKGLSYCAVCDGAFFKNKTVSVVGGGNSAVQEALYLANLAKRVNIIHRRDQLRAEKVLQQRAMNNPKIHFVWNSVVRDILGGKQEVVGLELFNKKTQGINGLPTNGVFIYIGAVPATKPFKNLGILDDKGWIKTDNLMETYIKGIFAVGDVRGKNLRQIATAVGDGAIAGQEAIKYINSLE